MKNSLERIVTKFACQIDEVLKGSSLPLFEKNVKNIYTKFNSVHFTTHEANDITL